MWDNPRMVNHVHTSAIHFLYILAAVTVALVLPRTWAAHHPDSGAARAILYIYG